MKNLFMIKICVFRIKYLFCFTLFVIFSSHFSEGFDSHVSLFCFFSISGIAPLITCYDLQFKNIFERFISFFMYFSYSAFQILLQILVLFNFLTVICNLITVNVLIVSCCQTIVWVFITNNVKGIQLSKKRLKPMQCFTDKTGSNGVLFLQEIYSDSKVEQKWKEDSIFFFSRKVKFL